MPLSQKDFADLVRSMPGASDDAIVAAAHAREQQSDPGILQRVWAALNAPLTTAPTALANKAADAIDQRSLTESPLAAKLKGFVAGATQGVGDLASQSTSPLSLALMAASGGAGRAVSAATRPIAASRAIESAAVSSKPAYALKDIASTVADLTGKNGGATYNLAKGDLIGTPHYAVGVLPERGAVIPGQASKAQIAKFIKDNLDVLSSPEHSIGTWFNAPEGKTYLDIAKTVPSLEDAQALARQHGQYSVFDLKNLQELPQDVPGVQQTPGTSNPEFHQVIR